MQSQANIDAEIDFLKICNFNGVLVSTPICYVEGVIAQQIQTPEGARPATIFPEIAGNSISKQLPTQLENFGRQLAIFHLQANRYPLNEDIPIYDLDTCLKKASRSSKNPCDNVQKSGAWYFLPKPHFKSDQETWALPLVQFFAERYSWRLNLF